MAAFALNHPKLVYIKEIVRWLDVKDRVIHARMFADWTRTDENRHPDALSLSHFFLLTGFGAIIVA
jgi:hypothetical protein